MAGSKLVTYNIAGHFILEKSIQSNSKQYYFMLSSLALLPPVQPLPYLTTVFRPLNHLILLYAQFSPNLCTHRESATTELNIIPSC